MITAAMKADGFSKPLDQQLTSSGDPVWIQVGKAFDGEKVHSNFHLVYTDREILHADSRPPATDILAPGQTHPAQVLPEHTVLPGLIEAHAHLFLEGGESNPDARAQTLQLDAEALLKQAEARLPRLLRAGIVAVRDAGDKDGVGLALQTRYRSGNTVMPYLDSPGPAIHHKGRYGKFMGEDLEALGGMESAVADRVQRGAFRIKLLATGIINFEKGAVTAKPQMPADELIAAVAAAKHHGKQTMVHCSGHPGVDNCIAAAVDTVEHGFFMDRDQLMQLRDRNMAWVPTFAPVQFQLDAPECIGWSQQVCDNLQRIVDAHARLLQDAKSLGVCVIAGSDAGSHGVPHAHGFFDELEQMERAGYPTLDILRSATARSAERLGFDQPMGRLQKGCLPRFILSDSDPLDSVCHLRAPSTVVFDGNVFSGGDSADQPGM